MIVAVPMDPLLYEDRDKFDPGAIPWALLVEAH